MSSRAAETRKAAAFSATPTDESVTCLDAFKIRLKKKTTKKMFLDLDCSF
jgi:hypothetical protein